ncbi:hypothetical protein [Clostridium tyrobutyricum]|jgi:Na+/proline symporter|uniref:hypothetical protein n=1 Tax=Clostridium tyrobutyricum TaxID=1519 RepID=UPI002010CBC7|nr:hypothetical protein [Clostridium tyrobutyricum]
MINALPQGQLGFIKLGCKTIIGLIIMYFLTFSTGQECVQRLFASKDEKNAVKGSMLCGNPKVSDEHLMHYSKTAVLIFGIIAICISLFSKHIIPMLVFAFIMRSAGPFNEPFEIMAVI